MALADLQQVWNTINAQQDRAQRTSEFAAQQKLQQQQLQQQRDLENKRLDLQHEHEMASLAAQQAYERVQQGNVFAQMTPQQLSQYPGAQATVTGRFNPPTEVSGTFGGGTGVGQAGAGLPNADFGNFQLPAGPAQTQRTVLPAMLGGEAQTITGPSPDQYAMEQGQRALLANKPLKELEAEQAAALEKTKADAEMNLTKFRTEADNASREKIASEERASQQLIARGQQDTERYVAGVHANAMLKAAGMGLQKQVDIPKVQQAYEDVVNGTATQESIMRNPAYSAEERQLLGDLFARNNVRPITEKQSAYLNQMSNMKNAISKMEEFITNQPSDSDIGRDTLAYTRGKLQTSGIPFLNNPDQITRLNEIGSNFGNIRDAMGTGSSSTRSMNEINLLLNGVKPGGELSQKANLKKLNDFKKSMETELNTTLNTIPNQDQRNAIIQNRIGDRNMFTPYLDVGHLLSHNPGSAQQDKSTPQVPTSPNLPRVTDTNSYNKVPAGASYVDPDGILRTKGKK